MAAATKKFFEVIDDLTECCICTELFTDPKALPCAHTFCRDCLETYVKDQRPGYRVTCPLCRQIFIVPCGGFIKLPGNLAVEKLVEIRKRNFFGLFTAKSDLPTGNCIEDRQLDDYNRHIIITRKASIEAVIRRNAKILHKWQKTKKKSILVTHTLTLTTIHLKHDLFTHICTNISHTRTTTYAHMHICNPPPKGAKIKSATWRISSISCRSFCSG